MNKAERRYRSVVSMVAKACALDRNPDRVFHTLMAGKTLGRGSFRDVMDYGDFPSAFADLLGDPVESFTPDDWDAVIENIAYMGFRADVLKRVAELKEGAD